MPVLARRCTFQRRLRSVWADASMGRRPSTVAYYARISRRVGMDLAHGVCSSVLTFLAVVHLCVPVLLLYVCAYCCCVARTIYRVMSLNCPSSRVLLLELCRCSSWLLARTYRLCGPTTKRFKQAWMGWRLPYSAGLPERSSIGNHGSNTKLFVGKGWSRCTEL